MYLSIAVYLTPEKVVNYVEQLLVHVAKKANIKMRTKKNINGCCRCSLTAAQVTQALQFCWPEPLGSSIRPAEEVLYLSERYFSEGSDKLQAGAMEGRGARVDL